MTHCHSVKVKYVILIPDGLYKGQCATPKDTAFVTLQKHQR